MSWVSPPLGAVAPLNVVGRRAADPVTHPLAGYCPHPSQSAAAARTDRRATKRVMFAPITTDGANVEDRGMDWQAVQTSTECGGPGGDQAGGPGSRATVGRRGGAPGVRCPGVVRHPWPPEADELPIGTAVPTACGSDRPAGGAQRQRSRPGPATGCLSGSAAAGGIGWATERSALGAGRRQGRRAGVERADRPPRRPDPAASISTAIAATACWHPIRRCPRPPLTSGRDTDLGSAPPAAKAPASPAAAATKARPSAHYPWALLIARLFLTLPLVCPRCGADMRIRAFITETAPVEHAT